MEEDREKYDVICPICSKEFKACKSIAQQMGINSAGSCRCVKCNTHLNLTFVPSEEIMDATEFSEWLKQKK